MSVFRSALLTLTAAACLVVLTMAPYAAAQGVTGTLSGTVRDSQGLIVPGATVTLTSETRGTVMSPVVTNESGDFVIPNIVADTYTVQVEMPSFRTLRQSGVVVSAGSRASIGSLTLEVGGTSEVVTVTSEAPLVQAQSGERSFTVDTESVQNLPLMNRSYDALLALAPGVESQPGNLTPATRLGGGGGGNFMLDGATAMDSGVNRPAARVSVEAVAEVRLVTSGYQAEYGRSSGLQINAITKSGSNQFRGSLYDVERNSRFNAISRENELNRDPKELQDERDWGFAIGGPVGKPGRNNKLFFYFNLEMNPRSFEGEVREFRLPTLLERQGDFSQSLDADGNLFPYVKDPLLQGTCSAASQVACFRDGGVLGRIPANRLYQTGLNILKWWPTPNRALTPGDPFNHSVTDPKINLLGYQPLIRVDYQPTPNLRGNFKFVEYQQPNSPILGELGEWDESFEDDYGIWIPAGSFNWTINQSTFAEVNVGMNFHHQEGCSVAGGEPNFCRNGLPTNPNSNRNTAGFGDIPYLFPDANIIEPGTFTHWALQRNDTPFWDGTRAHMAPEFSWGNRIEAPPNFQGPFSNFFLDTRNRTWNGSVTKVAGSHTLKGGYMYFRSLQRRGQGDMPGVINFGNDTANPLDTGFGFANAALGIFSSYGQQSRWGEGAYLAINHEFYLQDNWKVNNNFTLDYGVRFIYMKPLHDAYLKSSNFLPEKWDRNQAPLIYAPGCANGVYPCTGTNRQAMHPQTNQFLGPNSAVAIGTLVPGTGSISNGVFASGQGITKTNYTSDGLKPAPRVGAAWDVKGNQQFVVRGSVGLFYDRPSANTVYNTVNNPPFSRNVTVRYGQLQNIGSAGLSTEAPPALTVWQYYSGYPSSTQWNTGFQTELPGSLGLDVAYTGQHSWNFGQTVNINSIDLGSAFLPELRDPTSTSTVASTASLVSTNPNAVRFYRGYAGISQNQPIQERTYHSLQLSLQRRLRNGIAFGFNDTIGLYDRQTVAPRLQHNADGTITVRADQERAQELLGNQNPRKHTMRANFIYQIPGVGSGMLNQLSRDWSISGIWSGSSGTAYTVTHSYSSAGNSTNITGSPDFAPRIRIVGEPGKGCSDDPYRQFNVEAFAGPLVGSDGLESGNNYLFGCFVSQLDLAIARNIRLGGARRLEFRFDIFNAFNQAAVTGRATQITYASPAAPTTPTNSPFDASGNLIGTRSLPRGAGAGVATGYQDPRTIQIQLRFAF